MRLTKERIEEMQGQGTHLPIVQDLLDTIDALEADVDRLRSFVSEFLIDKRPLSESEIKRGQEIAKELGLEAGK